MVDFPWGYSIPWGYPITNIHSNFLFLVWDGSVFHIDILKRFYLRSFDHSVYEKDHLQDVEIITQVTEAVGDASTS